MSWSAQVTLPAGLNDQERRDRLRTLNATGNDDCPQERQLASTTAIAMVEDLVRRGILGPAIENSWLVTIGGHCNPENRKQSGSAYDSLMISIQQGK